MNDVYVRDRRPEPAGATTVPADDKGPPRTRGTWMAAALLACGIGGSAFAQPVTVNIALPPHAEPIIAPLLDTARAAANGAVNFESQPVGSLAALRELCRPPTVAGPRIVFTTRAMPYRMASSCETLTEGNLAAVELGRDAIVLAVRAGSGPSNLETSHIYHALARDTAAGDEFRRNVSIRWSDVDPSLPPQDIRFQIPPRTDHRRHVFDTLVMEGGCRSEDLIKGIFDASQRTARCTTIRIDRIREVAREHAVRSLLEAPMGTIGVLSYQDVAGSDGKLVAVALNDVIPTPSTIQEGTYPFASSYWLYTHHHSALNARMPRLGQEVARVLALAQSEAMIGPLGILTTAGLVPLPPDEREAQRAALAAHDAPYDLNWLAGWAVSIASHTWGALNYAVSDLRASTERDSVDLPKLMDTAGYKLAGFESSIGLIPGASMTFKIAREMSESDRDYLERELYKDSRARRSIRSALQRRLIQSIIDISESDGFQVTKVDVTLLPLPKVDLTISPQGSGSGSDSTTILRAIERLQERLPEVWR